MRRWGPRNKAAWIAVIPAGVTSESAASALQFASEEVHESLGRNPPIGPNERQDRKSVWTAPKLAQGGRALLPLMISGQPSAAIAAFVPLDERLNRTR